MNGYTLLSVLATLAGVAVVFLLSHHGPTGLLRATGLRLLDWADRIDNRWEMVRVQHSMKLHEIAHKGKPDSVRRVA